MNASALVATKRVFDKVFITIGTEMKLLRFFLVVGWRFAARFDQLLHHFYGVGIAIGQNGLEQVFDRLDVQAYKKSFV